MPVITRIKQQKNKNRLNIYLDDKFGFGLDLENFVKLNLRIEQELTETEIEEIKNTGDFAKYLSNILNFGMYRTRSEKEYRDWLHRKKVPDSFHKKLFSKLKYFNLLDDAKFAKLWVESRQEFRNKSKKELLYELKIKGISSDVIAQVLEDAEIDESKNIKKLLAKVGYKWEKLPKKDRNQKATVYLARHGFGWDEIKKALE